MTSFKKVRIALVCASVVSFCGVAGGLGPADDERADEKTIRKPTPIKQSAEEPARQPKTFKDAGSLLRARLELAEKGYQATSEGLSETRRQGNVLVYVGQPERAYDWSLRWLQADRDLNQSDADQLAALEAHLKRTIELEEKVENLSRDLLPKAALMDAQWHRLNAQLWLTQAKAKSH